MRERSFEKAPLLQKKTAGDSEGSRPAFFSMNPPFLRFICVDVAFFLFFEYLVDGNEYARLLDVAKLVVDGGAEHAHRGRQAHVAVDQRRYVEAQGAHLLVEYLVVVLEGVAFGKIFRSSS